MYACMYVCVCVCVRAYCNLGLLIVTKGEFTKEGEIHVSVCTALLGGGGGGGGGLKENL